MVTVELNDQEMDIVIGGIERLKEQLEASGQVELVKPVDTLMSRLTNEWDASNSCSGGCCGGCK